MNENELKHYGILGMKWGVRRNDEQLARNRETAEKVAKATGNSFKKSVINQTSQKIVNKAYGNTNKNEEIKKQAKTILKGAAVAATTTALAALMTSASDDLIKAGTKFAAPYGKKLVATLKDPDTSLVRDAIDILIAKHYGVY